MSIRAADEKTELLLLEYLDGTLPDEKRAELEAYLKAHPKEKQVLEDLAEHSRRLRSTPTESAPAEIFEVAQSHLERAALLDHFTDDAPVVPGRRAGPQWMSLAAVLVLGTGLGTALYFVLAPDGQPVDYATLPAPAPGIGSGIARLESTPAAASADRPTDSRGMSPDRNPTDRNTPDRNTPNRKPVVLADGTDKSAGEPLPTPNALSATAEAGTSGKPPATPAAAISTNTPPPSADVEPITRHLHIPTSDVALSRSRIEAVLQSGGWAFTTMSADAALKDDLLATSANQPLHLAQNAAPLNNYGQAPEPLNPSQNQQSPRSMLDQHQMLPSDRSNPPAPAAADSTPKEPATQPADNSNPPSAAAPNPTNTPPAGPPTGLESAPSTRPDSPPDSPAPNSPLQNSPTAPASTISPPPESARAPEVLPPNILPPGERQRRDEGTTPTTSPAPEVLVVRVESDQADALIAALSSIGKSPSPAGIDSLPPRLKTLLPGSANTDTSNDPTATPNALRQATTRDTMNPAKMVRLVVSFEPEAPTPPTESASTQPATTAPTPSTTQPAQP